MAEYLNEHNFIYEILNLKDDYEGKVIATFIKSKQNQGHKMSILYIHGFYDYFFQFGLAESFNQNGFSFYALELRKCGHSLLPHQHSNFCKDLNEYFEEIDNAIELILESGHHSIILLGHSLGGLISCLYMNCGKNRDSISALVLNSPFFDFNKPMLLKLVIPFMSRIVSCFFPFARTNKLSPSLNAKNIHKDYNGEWDFNTEWIPLNGYPIYWNWLNAVSKGFFILKQRSNITVPILIMHSSQSVRLKAYNPKFSNVDTVLNVSDIIRVSHSLGKDITLISVTNGMHDVFLSKFEVREFAFSQMIGWLKKRLIKNEKSY